MRLFLKTLPLLRHIHTQVKTMGVSLTEVVQSLQNFAPLTLAEPWDNVGLLVDPMTPKPLKAILLTNDLTEDVVTEAKTLDAGLIITYHPNIFQGLKSVSANTWKERMIIQCIKHEIGVFSPHTSWDCVEGGVNDWLAEAFAFKTIKPIKETAENPRQGSGRVLTLKAAITVQEAVEGVKRHLGLDQLRLALGRGQSAESPISRVALCAGSGASVLKGVAADVYLTGEMSHHDVLDATQNGVTVILCEHSNSERGFLKIFQKKLKEILLPTDVNIVVSQYDRDPLCVT